MSKKKRRQPHKGKAANREEPSKKQEHHDQSLSMEKTSDQPKGSRLSVLTNVILLVSTVAAAFFGALMWYDARVQIKPDVRLLAGRCELPKMRNAMLILGCPLHDPNAAYLGALWLAVANAGHRTLRNPIVTVEAPRLGFPIDIDLLYFKKVGVLSAFSDVKISQTQTGDFVHTSYKMNDITPDHAIGFEFPFAFHQTESSGIVRTEQGHVPYHMEWLLDGKLMLTADDISAEERTFFMRLVRANSLPEVLVEAMKILKQEDWCSDTHTLRDRLSSWFFGQSQPIIAAGFAEAQVVAEAKEGKVYKVMFDLNSLAELETRATIAPIHVTLTVAVAAMLGSFIILVRRYVKRRYADRTGQLSASQ